MISADWNRFVMAMTRLGVALDQPQSDERIKIFWDALRTTRIEAIEWAALEAEKKLDWFPKPKGLSDIAALAPLPDLSVSADVVKLLPDLEPPEVQRQKLREISETLNGSFGTSFGVGQEMGRPVLVTRSRR